ncbi:hypothetical protein ACLOJK_028196 [Asimina triloba]
MVKTALFIAHAARSAVYNEGSVPSKGNDLLRGSRVHQSMLQDSRGETFRDRRPGCIYLNEFMLKGSGAPEFFRGGSDISGSKFLKDNPSGDLVLRATFAVKKNTKIINNLLDSVKEWKMRVLGEITPHWEVPTEWSERLLEASSSHEVAPAYSLNDEERASQLTVASSRAMVVEPSGRAQEVVGSRELVKHPSEEQVEGEYLSLKRWCLVKGREVEEGRGGPTADGDCPFLGGGLTCWNRGRIEASSGEGSLAMVVNAKEEAFPLVDAAYEGGNASGIEDVPIKGPTARDPKKMAQFYGRGSTNARAEAKGSLTTSQAVERRRGPTPRVWANLGDTSSVQDDREIFGQSFDVEARVLKILSDLLLVETRAIQESAALGREPPLDIEGRGPRELMLLKFLPNVWRELRCEIHGLKMRIKFIQDQQQESCRPLCKRVMRDRNAVHLDSNAFEEFVM